MDNPYNRAIRAKRKIDRLKKIGTPATDEQYKYWLGENKQAIIEHIREIQANNCGCAIAIRKDIFSDGGIHVAVYEKSNGDLKHIKYISKELFPDEFLDKIQVYKNYIGNNPRCERCGEPATQLHHWAPQHLFDDANQWPTGYLCTACHKIWHETIKSHK